MSQDHQDETTTRRITTSRDYLDSLRGRNLKVYLFGELIAEPVDHPMIRPSINAVAETYDPAAQQPELATALSPLQVSASTVFCTSPRAPMIL